MGERHLSNLGFIALSIFRFVKSRPCEIFFDLFTSKQAMPNLEDGKRFRVWLVQQKHLTAQKSQSSRLEQVARRTAAGHWSHVMPAFCINFADGRMPSGTYPLDPGELTVYCIHLVGVSEPLRQHVSSFLHLHG